VISYHVNLLSETTLLGNTSRHNVFGGGGDPRPAMTMANGNHGVGNVQAGPTQQQQQLPQAQ